LLDGVWVDRNRIDAEADGDVYPDVVRDIANARDPMRRPLGRELLA